MNPFGLRFHHLGLAVRRPGDATRFLDGLGYQISNPVFDPEQNVNLILCRHTDAMPAVEIVYPGTAKSPIDAVVNLRPDGIIYHACYVTDDLSATLRSMEQHGVRAVCAVPPTPAVLFGGCPVSFYNIVGMGLCEIIEDRNHKII
jgi:Glyoxalase/Bleomycin resistance protein/Dioxygenase superfamily